MLAEGHDDEGREQRTHRLAEIPADLKQALGEAVPPAGRRAGDARGLRMEDRAADPDHRDRQQNERIGAREGEQQQPDDGEGHADRQDRVQRPAVEGEPDQRLEERGGELEDEGDDADLEETQRQLPCEHRIERRRQRLHRVVEHVRGAERGDDADRGRLGGPPLRGGVGIDRRCGHDSALSAQRPECARRKRPRPRKAASNNE